MLQLALAAMLFPLSMSATATSAAAHFGALRKDEQKVKVEVFYETHCPACQAFITGELAQLWADAEIREHVQPLLYPFGNGAASTDVSDQGTTSYTLTCQHGESECQGNLMHICAITQLNDPARFMPLIMCMESFLKTGMGTISEAGPSCATENGIDWNPIQDCVANPNTQRDMYAIAFYSNHLEPVRQYVPWVTVDGLHETGNLLQEVCAAIIAKGGSVPSTCQAQVPSLLRAGSNIFPEELKPRRPVCMGPGPEPAVLEE